MSKEIGGFRVVQEVSFLDLSILVGQLRDLSHLIFRHGDPVLAEDFDVLPHRDAAVPVFICDGVSPDFNSLFF